MIYEKHGIKDFFQWTIHSNTLNWQKIDLFLEKRSCRTKMHVIRF
jgi:hypothetical protein